MPADKELHQMYDLAHALHPDNGVALSVTLDACERITLMRRMLDLRAGSYRLRLPEACLPQCCVYLASDAREREQEHPRPGKEPRYQPTPDDWLVRYVKFLVWWTMDRNACHVAVALGCFLHGYQPAEIASLAPDLFHQNNIRRVKRRLAQQIRTRFQRVPIGMDDHQTFRTHPATERERGIIHKALTLFTPWGCPHVPSHPPDDSILETHFDGAVTRSEWERIHALIDPHCAGLPRLIREYNRLFPHGSMMRLDDPDQTLEIPCFDC
jgi:hypothetical protein